MLSILLRKLYFFISFCSCGLYLYLLWILIRSTWWVLQMSTQLILAYSWARPAILVAGKGRGGCFYFFFFFTFIPVPLSFLSLSSPLLSLLSLFSLSLGDDTKWPTRVDMSLNPNSINSNEYPQHLFLWKDHKNISWCYAYYVSIFHILVGVVGCGEGVVYLMSLGRPTDIG